MNKSTLGEKILAFVICSAIIAFGFLMCYSIKMTTEEAIATEARITEYKLSNHCRVSGFAGRYAEIKVYTCDTGIKIEKDMK
jgi:hypothetical protein